MTNNRKAYVIQKGCVGCGACKVVCPIHCIRKGTPFSIQTDKCIGCGKCVVRCWRGVIVPK